MPQNKLTSRVIQIKNLDPDIIRKAEHYKIDHGNMTHAQLFTKAFLALIAAEQNSPK